MTTPMKKHCMRVFLGAWIIATAGMPLPSARADERYKIGVLATRGHDACAKEWASTARYLEDNIPGNTFLIVPLNPADIESAVAGRKIDFLIVNPALYIEQQMLHKAQRIATLESRGARAGVTVYGSVIFTRAGNQHIHTLADLRKKRVVISDDRSFGGWIVALRELEAAGINPERDFAQLRTGVFQDQVVYAVRDGESDAGIVRTGILEQMSQEGRIDLSAFKILPAYSGRTEDFPFVTSTRLYPEWTIAKLEHTPVAVAKEVMRQLLHINPDDLAAINGKYWGWTVPLNYRLVEECLEEVRWGPYKDYGKISMNSIVRQYWPWMASILVLLSVVISILARSMVLNRRLRVSRAAMMNERNRAQQYLNVAGVMLIALDTRARVTMANPKACELLGYSQDELVGRDWIETCIPQDCQSHVRTIFQSLVSGVEQAHEHEENEIITKSGQRRLIVWHNAPLRDELGRLTGTLSSGEDITERKRMQRELDRHEAYLSRIMEAVAHPFYVIDADSYEIKYANSMARNSACAGMRTCYSLTHCLDKPCSGTHVCPLEQVKKTGQPVIVEHVHYDTSGKPVDVEVHGYPLFDEGGKVIQMVEYCLDITERKRVQQQQERLLQNLEETNAIMVGRELRMIELKQEINRLLASLGRPQAYDTSFAGQVEEGK